MRRLQTNFNSRALIALTLGLGLALVDFVFRCLPLKGGIVHFVSFTTFHNQGVAFNWHSPLPLLIVATAFALIISGHLLLSSPNLMSALAASAVLIGTAANATERLIHIYITDYWLFFGRTAINLADVLIVVGAIYFLWYFKDRKQPSVVSPNPQI